MIARYPLTNAQYQAFVDAGGYDDERWWLGLDKHIPVMLDLTDSNRPQADATWYMAVAYCRWLSAQIGLQVTLPTESQWEKAARGTDGRLYPWGNKYQAGYANINESSLENGRENLDEYSVVGIYPQDASPYGVMEMAGNTLEWCLDEYEYDAPPNEYYDEAEEARFYMQGPLRVLRGAFFLESAEFSFVSSRIYGGAEDYGFYHGFRLVVVPTNNQIRSQCQETDPRNVEVSKKGESENRA